MAASARPTARALAGRAAGSLASSLATNSSSGVGTSGTIAESLGGVSRRCRLSTSDTSLPRNGGLPAIIAPLGVGNKAATRDIGLLLLASVIVAALGWNNVIVWWEGIVMVAMLAGYLGLAYTMARRDAASAQLYAEELEEFESGPQKKPLIIASVIG